jgi:hydrogenase nickel insertion protein HypA
MHEYSIVEQFVEQILEHLKKENVTSVKSIRFQRGSTFAEDPLRQAWDLLTENTILHDAEVFVEERVEELDCENCGHKESIHADDLIGHMVVCPECGAAKAIDEGSGLQVLEIIA